MNSSSSLEVLSNLEGLAQAEGLEHLSSTTGDGPKARARGVSDQVSTRVARGNSDETTVTSSSIVGASLGWDAGASLGWGIGAHAEVDGPPDTNPCMASSPPPSSVVM